MTQLIPFNRVAWHAGVISWEGYRCLNGHSVGIELQNAGMLLPKERRWLAWFGKTYGGDEVVETVHRHGTESRG